MPLLGFLVIKGITAKLALPVHLAYTPTPSIYYYLLLTDSAVLVIIYPSSNIVAGHI